MKWRDWMFEVLAIFVMVAFSWLVAWSYSSMALTRIELFHANLTKLWAWGITLLAILWLIGRVWNLILVRWWKDRGQH